jgi:glucose-1-phosphatase
MKLEGIQNITFDLGGVIINLNQQLTYQAFEQLFPSHFIEIQDQLKKENTLNKFETNEILQHEFLALFKAYDDGISDTQLVNAWNSMLLDIPEERIELIKNLSKRYNVYLLSNTNSIHLSYINNYVVKHFGLEKLDGLFKKAYYSHQITLRKPNKAIFEYVLTDANLMANKTLFIDDTIEHIESAKKLGIQTHYLNLEEGEHLIKLFA